MADFDDLVWKDVDDLRQAVIGLKGERLPRWKCV